MRTGVIGINISVFKIMVYDFDNWASDQLGLLLRQFDLIGKRAHGKWLRFHDLPQHLPSLVPFGPETRPYCLLRLFIA